MVHRCKKIETKDWIVKESAGDLLIFKKMKGMKKKPIDFRQYRGTLASEEPNWQPASIQVGQDSMKSMEESNVKIFFDKMDLKKKEWGNRGLPY